MFTSALKNFEWVITEKALLNQVNSLPNGRLLVLKRARNYLLIRNRMPAMTAQMPAIRFITSPPRLTPKRARPAMIKYIPSRIHLRLRILFLLLVEWAITKKLGLIRTDTGDASASSRRVSAMIKHQR